MMEALNYNGLQNGFTTSVCRGGYDSGSPERSPGKPRRVDRLRVYCHKLSKGFHDEGSASQKISTAEER